MLKTAGNLEVDASWIRLYRGRFEHDFDLLLPFIPILSL